jgi:hypothetical protein
VGTLQNVAVISSMQITPVVVPVEVPVVARVEVPGVVPVVVPVIVPIEVPGVVPVATCAAAGHVARSSAVINPEINASCFMCVLVLRWSITDQAMQTGRYGTRRCSS